MNLLIFGIMLGLLLLVMLTAREVVKIGRLHNDLCDIVRVMKADVDNLAVSALSRKHDAA